jgi:signal transduction histidine kinase
MSKWRNYYLTAVSIVGLVLVVCGIVQIPTFDNPGILALMVLLAVVAQVTATSLFSGEVTVGVSTAISMATVPFFGPFAAATVNAAAELSVSLISIYQQKPGWRRSLERVGFNVGMGSISIFIGGVVFGAVQQALEPEQWVGQIIPWPIGAIVTDQINLWLLIAMIYLQNGARPLDIWKDHRWAMSINILVTSIGGGLLAFSLNQFDWWGVAIFFLPIMLSAYSFRLYVIRAREQMSHLEEMVEQRTRALAEVNKTLADLHREKDAFLAVLTHDMRTPLTSILGFADLLAMHDHLPLDRVKEISRIVLRNGETLLEIVNNILDIEKLQSGAPVLLDRENFDLGVLVQDCVEAVSPQAVEKAITLTCEIPPTLFVNADQQKIKRVILNLVSNGVKYTQEEGKVKIMLVENSRYAILSVADTGHGIPADELPFIFERFRRVGKHRKLAVGTGLGLTIVQSLVQAHDGEILVESEEGVGSTFTVKLPL